MTLDRIVASVPGKLVLAGEYAVLEPGEPAIALAIDRRLIVKLAPAGRCTLSAPSIGMTDASARLDEQGWTLEAPPSPRTHFAAAAINTALAYLRQLGKTLEPFAIHLEGQLESPEGTKYGFGSSAAVCVGLVGALLAACKVAPSAETMYKLAILAHGATQGNGSGLDVAATTFGGTIRYTAPDRSWLEGQLAARRPLAELVQAEWPNLGVEPLGWPDPLLLAVGWTGTPASTRHLIQGVAALAASRDPRYARFLVESRQAANRLAAALRDRDPQEAIDALLAARRALASLQAASGVPIETPPLAMLAQRAEQYGGAGKASGAGGGDCGVAFFRTEADRQKAVHAWAEEGIVVLDVLPWPGGLQILQG